MKVENMFVLYIYILYATIFVNPYQKKNLKKNEQFLCAKI